MTAVAIVFPPAQDTLPLRHALIFSPVLPQWDQGAFFTPVTDVLRLAGFQVTVVDTLSLWDVSTTTVRELAERWRNEIRRFGEVDLLVGNALGGAVAQALAGALSPSCGVLLVSSPTLADSVLGDRLSAIAVLAEQGRLGEALALLGRRVLPEGESGPVDNLEPTVGPAAGRRLARGMRLLLELDLVDDVRRYAGPLVHIVGARSQLVTDKHVAGAAHHQIVSVSGAGMRPHSDSPEIVAAIVGQFVTASG
jgi:pimeloyl-ACP methyl ester carboxylesterase